MMLRLSTPKPFITPSKLEALKTRGLYHNTHVCPEAILMYSIAKLDAMLGECIMLYIYG